MARVSRPAVVFGAVVAAVAVLIGVAAVTSEDYDAMASEIEEAAGLSATVEQTTAFQARGLLEIAFRNRSPHEVSITSLRLVDDRFQPLAATPRDAGIPPGPRRLMVPLGAGPPVCEARPGGRSRPAVEVIEEASGRRMLVPIDEEGREFLALLHDRQCGQARIREVVDVDFVGPFTDLGPATLRMSLRLARREPDAAVAVAGMRGTVVFAVTTPSRSPLLVLPAGEAIGSVAVEVSASRCDAHALIESKKSYRFPMWIGLDGGEPRYLEVEPTGAARRALEQTLQEGCFPDG